MIEKNSFQSNLQTANLLEEMRQKLDEEYTQYVRVQYSIRNTIGILIMWKVGKRMFAFHVHDSILKTSSPYSLSMKFSMEYLC